MRDALIDLLVCPPCQTALTVSGGTKNGPHVMSGELRCARCGARTPIVDGVPDFVCGVGDATGAAQSGDAPNHGAPAGSRAHKSVEQTTSGFAMNWQRYSRVILAEPALNDELFRDWIAPVQPESFEGKAVLDAGCGMGRWLAAAAPHMPQTLVGFDYSEVVHAAFDNTRHLKHVHVVRADIFRLPFRRVFDACYSIGVVHHTPDPEGAFAALLDAVVDDGILAVWVYGKENNAWIETVVSPLRRLFTSRLPDTALLVLTKVLTLQLAAAAHGYARAFPAPTTFPYDAYARHLLKYPRPYLEHIVYDHLVPQLAQYLPREELEAWATKRGLTYSLTSRNANSWRLITARSVSALDAFTT